MMQKRIKYLMLAGSTIILGLTSRQIHWIPMFVGDVLYAVMMFFIVRMLIVRASVQRTALTALLITYAIEFSQLYQAEWINGIRRTLPGRLVLGQGFLRSDLMAYTVGVFTAVAIAQIVERKSY